MRHLGLAVAAVAVLIMIPAWVISTSPDSQAALTPRAPAAKAPAAGAATEGEWPCFHGPARDARSPDKGLLKEWPAGGPALVWKYDGVGQGFSSIAVSGGMVYTSGDVGGRFVVFGLDMDGKPQLKIDHDDAWTQSSNLGARSTPTIDGGNLYIESGKGLVGCYDAKAGGKKWTVSLSQFGGKRGGWGYAESVLIEGNMAVVTPGGSKCIVALNKMTGQPIWASSGFSAGAQYGGCAPFTFQDVPLIAAGTDAGLVCVDGRSGALIFSNDWSAKNTANCPTPVYSDGHVFWANGYGKGGICMQLAAAGGKIAAQQAWTTTDMVCHHGGYIIDNGYIYGDNGGGVTCLELKTGKVMWKNKGVGKGSVLWADGMLYLFSERGGKAALATCSPEGMQMKGEFSVAGNGPSWAHPVVIGGRLYLRYDTNLYCYDVKAK
jgi:outer membrane protein assembly factor BamB